MNTRSIRFRLTFWYSLTFFLGLVLAFISFYLIAYRVLFNQTDTTLRLHGDKVVEVVSQTNDSLHEIMSQRAFISEFSEIPGMLVTILDTRGELVSSSMMCCYDEKVFGDLFQKALNNKKYLLVNQTLSGENMRFYVSPVYIQNLFLGVVVVGHPIGVIQNSLNSIFLILTGISVFLLIPTIFGGYLLSKKALVPISDLSEKLKYITTENLHEKVENKHTGDEIERLIKSFNLLLDRLNASFKRERHFIGDIAHELKTPLSIMSGNIELSLTKKRTREELHETLIEAKKDVENLSLIINNVLDLAWSQADNFRVNLKQFNLSDMLVELNEITQNLAREKNIKVASKIQKGITVEGHPDKLIRSILNILDNAVKYSPAGSTISINLKRIKNEALLEIKDQGKGIKEKDLPHIFDRFYRSDEVKNLEGSGLGLAIAKGIIAAHGGHISIVSTLNKGTQVKISLPFSKS